jgi:hypothetical protein
MPIAVSSGGDVLQTCRIGVQHAPEKEPLDRVFGHIAVAHDPFATMSDFGPFPIPSALFDNGDIRGGRSTRCAAVEVLECREDPLEPSCQRDESSTGGGLDDEPGQAWRNDVALQLWVDVSGDAVVITLEGVLDRATGANLVAIITECQAEGVSRFSFETRGVRVAHSGWEVVNRAQTEIRSAGGEFHWSTADLRPYAWNRQWGAMAVEASAPEGQ